MTLIGNRPRVGADDGRVLSDRRGRAAVQRAAARQGPAAAARRRPAELIVADERNAAELPRHCATAACEVADRSPTRRCSTPSRRRRSSSTPTDPCLITFTSGTTGEAKGIVHGQRYLPGQPLQAEHWLDARPGDLVWCTAASGWSKSARNVFIAPWLRGAAALLHDARFDPAPAARAARAESASTCSAWRRPSTA